MHLVDRSHLKAFLKEAASHPGPRYEGTRRNGSRLILQRNPEAGVHEVLTEVEVDGTVREHMRSYSPTSERPDGYPDHMPFLPDLPVSVDYVDDRGESTRLTWTEVPDPGPVTRQLLQMAIADGWEVVRSHETSTMGPVAKIIEVVMGMEVGIHDLRRGERRRHLRMLPRPGGGPASVELHESRRAIPGRVVTAGEKD